MNRREFLHNAGRYLIFTGIIATSGYMIRKKNILSADGCTVSDLCKNCKEYSRCDLPQALKSKGH